MFVKMSSSVVFKYVFNFLYLNCLIKFSRIAWMKLSRFRNNSRTRILN